MLKLFSKTTIKHGLLTVIILPLAFGCQQKTEANDLSFTFIGRNEYSVDSYNGISYYRKKDSTRQLMDGYYVVGNEVTKWEEFELNKGILHGDYIIFHTNGEIYSHTKYVNGKRHGVELSYSNKGVLTQKSTYKNDVLTGTKYHYFDNGKVKSESKIEDGESVESVTYDILGNITSQQFIRDGRTITQKIVEGKVYSEMISSNYDNFEAVKFFNEDGSLDLYLRMFQQGDKAYLIELDEEGNEIKRVDVKANPEEALKYQKYFVR